MAHNSIPNPEERTFDKYYPYPELTEKWHLPYEIGRTPFEYGLDTECWIADNTRKIKGTQEESSCSVPMLCGACRRTSGHTVSWELYHRKLVPEGYSLHHLCYNRICINHLHLVCIPNGLHRNLEKIFAAALIKCGKDIEQTIQAYHQSGCEAYAEHQA